jgi:hypothetical protein
MTGKLILLALLANLLVAPVAWGLATLMDWSRASARARHAVWTAAFWAPVLTVLAVLATPWLPAHHLMGVLVPRPAELVRAGIDSEPGGGPPIVAILLAVAAAGAALRLGWLGAKLARLRSIAANATQGLGEIEGLPVRLSEELTSPLLVGAVRPTILLPARFGASEMAPAARLICRHEAAHAARHDNLRLLAEEIAIAVFWFDIVQLRLRARMSEAREEICDAAAMTGADPRERSLYARSLLDCLNARATGLIATALIGQPRRHAAMRIDAILTPKPQYPRAALAAGLVTLLAATSAAAFAWSAGLAPKAPAPAAAPAPTGGKAIAKMGPIDISSDESVTDPAHHIAIWKGNVMLTGVTPENMDGLFIDGRPATVADVAGLSKTTFASVKASFNPNGHELDRLDVQTQPGAPN